MPSNLYARMKIRKHTKKTKYTRSKKKRSRKRTIHKNKKTRNLKRKNRRNAGVRPYGWKAPTPRPPTERERREIEKQVGRDKLARRGRSWESAAQKRLIIDKLMDAGFTQKDAERALKHVPRGKLDDVVRSLLTPGPIERLIKIGYAPDNAWRLLEGVPPENVEAVVEEAERLIKIGYSPDNAWRLLEGHVAALAGVEDKDYIDAIIRLTGRHPKDILEDRPGRASVLGNPDDLVDSWDSFVVG